MAVLKAGFAERAITPELGVAMAGYFEPHRAEEIVNDLYANALVLQRGSGPPFVMVSCDVIALNRDTVTSIRRKLENRLGIPPGNAMLFAVHNHTGPATIDILGGMADRSYLASLEMQIVDAVQAALENLQKATLGFARGQEHRISCNRRLILEDGTTHTHLTDADMPEVVGREGPADPEVGVLYAATEDGNALGLVVNFALHPTNVRGHRICSDYPRYLAEHLKAAYGEHVLTVFANGACGNIDSKTLELSDVPYGPGRAQRIGAILGEAVLKAVEDRQALSDGDLAVAGETIQLPLRGVAPQQVALAEQVLAQEEPTELVFSKGTRRPSALKERVYAQEAILLAERRRQRAYVEAEVQVIRIGDVAVVGLPVELFAEFGLEIKRLARKRFNHAMVVGLANGYLGYVPLPKSFEGGGYETRPARSSQLAPEAGDLLVAAAARLLATV